ncbi:AAA family ATPase [Neolewinella lacunae]|uniref:AAA family ATPase n=1 Tax=Neolewinella lacunae TaxID=1517758 RepID=A0A923PQG8_9BACT|nr:AAA family ATPase [Neolewinella lacunae]MBC6995911.1 AAA family ATPase [Neolewinella lacunae]MDN3636396.1 AAA family ATPase [Neolewinella lacunae]
MRLISATIENFKGIEALSLVLDPSLNIVIGDNGSGKTAILEAFTIAVGSLLVGMKNVPTRTIKKSDVRFTMFQEYAYPVTIAAEAEVLGQRISWSRSKNSQRGGTTTKEAQSIIELGKKLDRQVRNGEQINLPLISFFSTSRLFVEAKSKQSFPQQEVGKELGSRYRGYRTSLDVRSNFRHFLKWFEAKELSTIQRRKQDEGLEQVRSAIVNNLPGCKHLFFDFDPDTNRGLTIELEDGRSLPFDYLSDGMRNFVAMMADIAHRCVTLNPHLEDRALRETQGIVLIDELDLHLHPSWQKAVITGLRETFPAIQFIISTHSPYLIQEAGDGQLIHLNNCDVTEISGADQLSLEDVAEFKQGVADPQMSHKKKALYEAAEDYLQTIRKDGKADERKKALLASKLRPFSSNPAIDALLELEKLNRAEK